MVILAGSMVISLITLENGNCMSKKKCGGWNAKGGEGENHEERKDNNENE